MFRTNTPADVASSGKVEVNAGEGVQFTVPVKPYVLYDSGWRDITGRVPDATVGNLLIRRVGHAVSLDFRGLSGALPGSAWYSWPGTIPAGFNVPRNWQYFALASWHPSRSAGPIRLATSGSVIVYNAKYTDGGGVDQPASIDATITWLTDEAEPATLPGTPA